MGNVLKGKNAIITGSNRGIGRATLELFAKNGANIWACCRSMSKEDEKVFFKLMEEYGVWIKPVCFDLRDEKSLNGAVRGIIGEKQPIDILINNAAVSYGTALSMMPVCQIKDVFDVNYFAQLQMMQIVTRVMIRQKKGVIINMGSVSGMEVYPGNLAYGSSKAALMYATKLLSKEYAPYGIRINAVAPGTVHTEMGRTRSEEQMKAVIARTAMKRRATPAEIANIICFLASDDASFMTGSVVIADGGRIDF